MSPLAWLAIPLLAVVVSTAAVTWRARPRPRAQMRDARRRYERFQAAFAASDAQQGAPRRR